MIHAVILAGGWGRRFWPKSRKALPKQLLCLGSRHSSFQNLFAIVKSQIPKKRIWVVANQGYAEILRKQIPSLPRRNLLFEPLSRNTAAAIGLASVIIRKTDPDAITLVLSSDQIIGKKAAFLKTLKQAANKAKEGDVLLTIGIRPHRPATEYGYLKTAKAKKICKVKRFIEKPNLARAKKYLRSKNYFWNAGIFVWKAETILKEIKKYLPGLYSGLERIEKAWGSPGYKRRLLNEYKRFKAVSITYGIMEKSRKIYTVRGNFPWQDLGSWDNLAQDSGQKDSCGNVIQGLHQGLDTCNCVIVGEGKHLIATLGLRDLIIVHTPDATLVCRKDQAQKVKQLSKNLEKNKRLKKYL